MHQDFIKSVLITLLDYFSRMSSKNGTQTLILKKVQTPPFLEYLYSNEFLLSQVNEDINEAVKASINKYIDVIKSVQISLFSAQ